jgi:hypothetical protein
VRWENIDIDMSKKKMVERTRMSKTQVIKRVELERVQPNNNPN